MWSNVCGCYQWYYEAWFGRRSGKWNEVIKDVEWDCGCRKWGS